MSDPLHIVQVGNSWEGGGGSTCNIHGMAKLANTFVSQVIIVSYGS